MQGCSKEEQEKIITSFKNVMKNVCELQDDILSISEESIDQISTNIINKYHCFSTKETTSNFLSLISSSIRIRPLKVGLYGKLLFKVSKFLAPFTSQQELMHLFATNKLIILYLFESKLITIDTIIQYQQTNHQYTYYFYNEIRNNDAIYFGNLVMKSEELEEFILSTTPEEHDKKRRIGLNDGKFETMIRECKIPAVHPNEKVSNSLYEISDFLSNITYAEYSSYFGSIDVLKYFLTFSDLKAKKLLNFAIAGNQLDTVTFLLGQNTKRIKLNHECLRMSIEFHTMKDCMNDFFNIKKFLDIKDLCLSIKSMNWYYFIDNLLFVSDKINDVCDENDEKKTLLHFACSLGCKNVAKLLLSLFGDKNYFDHDYENDKNFDYVESASKSARKSLINVNVQDKFKRTPLHLAVASQKVEIVKILFKCDDTNFHVQDNDGKTAAHYSAESKNMEIVKLFVDSCPNHEIDLSIPDNKGNTAFHYFCKPRCFEPAILKYVCESERVNPNHLNHKNVTEVMHSIIKKNRIQILQVLVDSDHVDLNFQTPKRKETALMVAAQQNNFEACKLLMKDPERIDPNLQDFKDRTALHISIHHVSKNIFEFLIKQPAVNLNLIDDFELTPAFSTLYRHKFYFFESMVMSYKERKKSNDQKYAQNNINLDHRDHFSQNLLHYAIRCQYPLSLDFLLKTYSVNEPDSKGTTAFHQACSIGSVDMVKYLIKMLGTSTDEEENNTAGLYNSSTDKNGESVIKNEEKKEIDDLKIARYKPGEKIRINQKDSNGLTPFHYACQCDSVELIKYLLSVPEIKINEKDRRGETPFFYACKFGFFEIAKIVFQNKEIDPYSENVHRITALSYLSKQDQNDIFYN